MTDWPRELRVNLNDPPVYILQFDLDMRDQYLAKNLAREVIGTRVEATEVKPTSLQPEMEVLGLQRFRECEMICRD
ncbi:hypothetical protein K1719_001923 [Acacia pycnantha]|nr:hypothetical protein K1719_001923 [Acacia pycnantha]